MQNRELRYYCIGDLVIEYDGPFFEEKGFLSRFRTEKQMSDVSYKAIVCENMTLPEMPCVFQSNYLDEFRNEEEWIRVIYGWDKEDIVAVDYTCDGVSHMVRIAEVWADKISSRLALNLFNVPYQIIAHNAMFLHASYIIWKGKAILFTAPKQVGKTTQAKLWEKYAGAKAVNGDRALLRKKDDQWMVHGSPYCGTSKICENISAPLGAIVILSQASQNRIQRAKTTEAVIAFMDGASFRASDKSQVEKVADMVNDIIGDVSIYKMECTPTEDAVRLLEEMLW